MKLEATIRKAVEKCEKSQSQLAKEAGISQVAVHKFLKKNMSLSGDKLQALGKAAGVKIIVKKI
jgi:transcriptional regulator with XRE-family HTH domain